MSGQEAFAFLVIEITAVAWLFLGEYETASIMGAIGLVLLVLSPARRTPLEGDER